MENNERSGIVILLILILAVPIVSAAPDIIGTQIPEVGYNAHNDVSEDGYINLIDLITFTVSRYGNDPNPKEVPIADLPDGDPEYQT